MPADTPFADVVPPIPKGVIQTHFTRTNGEKVFYTIGELGGGSVAALYVSSGDPNGVVTAEAVPALCYDVTNSIWWAKTSGAGQNTGWV